MPAARQLSSRQLSRKKPRASRWTTGSNTSTPGRRVSTTFKASARFVLDRLGEIAAVLAVPQRAREPHHRGAIEPALSQRDLLDAGDLEPLALLDRLDEVRRLEQRLVSAGVEPRDAATEPDHVELAGAQVLAVDVGDLELAARGRLERLGDRDHAVVVEVEARHG